MNHWKPGASWLSWTILLCMRGYQNRWALDLFICSSWWADFPFLCLKQCQMETKKGDWGKLGLGFLSLHEPGSSRHELPRGLGLDVWRAWELCLHGLMGKRPEQSHFPSVLDGGTAGPVSRERVCGVVLGILQQTAHLSRTGHSECASRTHSELKPGVRMKRSPGEETYHQGSVTGPQVAAVRIARRLYRLDEASATRIWLSSCRLHRYSESLSLLPPES